MTSPSKTNPTPNRGEVWWIQFDPSVGSEQRKTRPAVVMNVPAVGKLPLRIVVPITEWETSHRRTGVALIRMAGLARSL